MKNCELCKSTARIYCDSDHASLCWTCDAQVHSANFLVAKHSRRLLCKICQSPTTWTAFGEKLSPSTASICGNCDVAGVSNDHDDRKERVGGNDGETVSQVMLWNSTPPSTASSSTTEEFFSCKGAVKLKRKRQNVTDLTLKDELDYSSVNTHQHKMTSCDSTVSSSNAKVMKPKRIHQRTNIYYDYMSTPVIDKSKSTKIAKFDLNLLP